MAYIYNEEKINNFKVNSISKDGYVEIEKYKLFITNILQPKLQLLIKEREQLDKTLLEYFKLKSHILQIQNEQLDQIKVMIDIGSSFYVQSKITDTSKVIVSLDCGEIYIEMTHNEALQFIDKKEDILKKRAEMKSNSINKIRAHIFLIHINFETLRKSLA
ncbi:unnamed protein product [Pneumocystis jirovecii]|uniref:Prefoldin, alpha subunit n=1 Tax=Pneumocystis jirovecii TaxID=42068 RepID=L0PDC5_PNEJI|nr:unnamed protein product [Pneumocystis jirovecii]